eukprot:scaffold39968_cov22-Tisochrysis_lutea.AAC.3
MSNTKIPECDHQTPTPLGVAHEGCPSTMRIIATGAGLPCPTQAAALIADFLLSFRCPHCHIVPQALASHVLPKLLPKPAEIKTRQGKGRLQWGQPGSHLTR